MSKYREQLEAYLKTLKITTGDVADVAGGSNPVKNRVGSIKCNRYHIWDNGLEEQETPPDYIQDFNLEISDGEYPMYDLVFCLELFEYIHDPKQAVVNLNYLTKPGGRLIVTFPFVYPVHRPVEADTLRYTPQGAVRLLEQTGFQIDKVIHRVDRSGKLAEFYKADGMHIASHSNTTGIIIESTKL